MVSLITVSAPLRVRIASWSCLAALTWIIVDGGIQFSALYSRPLMRWAELKTRHCQRGLISKLHLRAAWRKSTEL
ncbi:hypothetical protein BDW72DRAFT_172903 [Aspergillus terricola var. indicus]